jgi:diguanylate cyclase (GGDEF)-like protein
MYGFIIFGEKILNTPYSNFELEYIGQVMKFASVSLQNNINYRRAIYDSKTRLYNHSYFSLRLEEEFARIKRRHADIALILIDIDFFKKLNDKYGHLAGDKMLAHISALIQSCLRDEDIAGRFGGEEFIIMLIQCDEAQALLVSERIRNAIEQSPLMYDKDEIKSTISAGISSVKKGSKIYPDDLIKQADIALYQSKRNGRNQITIYKEGMSDKT